MTSEEQELLENYLTHLNVLGEHGSYPDFEAWYQEVRYAHGPSAPRTLEEAAELRYKDIQDAARLFNQFPRDQATDKCLLSPWLTLP